jgi:threonine/homoserine/homoserine lactone efflux protein
MEEILKFQPMNFQDLLSQIGPFEMAIKGMIIGIVASAPMGPVGVLCVQRTLNKGRWYGFMTGVGAAVSDIIYAAIAGYGLSFVIDIIENPVVSYWIKVAGSILLFVFGVFTFRSNPVQKVRPVSRNKSNLIHNFFTGLFVTLSNPLILFLFVAMFGQFTFVVNNWVPQLVGYLFIMVGALLWWFGLTWLIDKVRNKFDVRGIWIINRIIGIVVMVVSAAVAISVLTGNFFSFD